MKPVIHGSQPKRLLLSPFGNLSPRRKALRRGLLLFTLLGTLLSALSVLSAVESSVLFGALENHYFQKLDENRSIDWTEGTIFARARVRLPRIVNDRNHPDFGTSGTERTLTRARSHAREEAMEQASLRLMDAVEQLPLNARFTIRERMESDLNLRSKLGRVTESFLVKSRQTGEGFVAVELALPFRKESGLYSYLVDERYSRAPVPELDGGDVEDPVTGIIIDVSEYPGFRPSLEPGIYTDQGRKIYGPEVVSRRYAVRRGLSAYYDTAEEARRDPRLGLHPYYTFAAGVMGDTRSDLFLDSEDAARILSSPSGREALRKCAVVFILSRK